MEFDWQSVELSRPRIAGQHRPLVIGSFAAWGRLLGMKDSPIGLPVFQRGSAWNERRVEMLWDSLSRGYPVGTLLLAETGSQVADYEWVAKPLPSGHAGMATAIAPRPPALQLLDGQQRCVALALGFRPWDDATSMKLWLDVAALARADDGESRRRRFHACSWPHLWGRDQEERRASLAQRRRARWALGLAPHGDGELTLGETFPVDAEAPVALADIVQLLLKGQAPSLEGCLALVPDAALARPKRLERGAPPLDGPQRKSLAADRRAGLMQELDAHALADSLTRLRAALERPLLALVATGLETGQDLIESFVRLNRQGVALSEPELFFSGLKHLWPPANDLVLAVQKDPDVGHVLAPTSIVHLAVRIAAPAIAARGPESDVPRLDVDVFRRLTREGGDGLRTEMRHLLEAVPGTRRGRLAEVLADARRLLQFRPDARDDVGMPVPLLVALHWRAWHAIAAWVHAMPPDRRAEIEAQRAEVLRYAFLDHLFLDTTSEQAITRPFVLARAGDLQFPGAAIHAELQAKDLLSIEMIPSPTEYEARVQEDRARWEILRNEMALVTWGQRWRLATWFKDWDPFVGLAADDLPYDVDHITPSASLNRQGKGTQGLPENFMRDRDALRESIGNKRLWPREANRSDQDEAAKDKLFLMAVEDDVLDSTDWDPARWALRTAGDVRRASLIRDDDVRAWQAASSATGDDKDWTTPARFEAFRRAVDLRRVRLYRELHEAIGFGEWRPAEVGAGVEL